MVSKVQLAPNTTLYPVPVVLITCGARDQYNIFTVNRIASCNAEPPMLSVSVRPSRASHDLIAGLGEFVVNIPWPDMEVVSDFVGSTTMTAVDKWLETGLTALPAAQVRPPLLAECPVNIECRVQDTINLPSHSMFVGEVVALHANREVLNKRDEVDFNKAMSGLAYSAGTVRERPIRNFHPQELLQQVRARRPHS